nr:MAG TPA: hypothetical protein [Caudoviricetes sp.]
MSHLPPLVDLGFIAGLAVCRQAVRACGHRARPPGKGLGHIHAAGRKRLVVCVDFFSQRHKSRRHAHGLHRAVKGLCHQITVPGFVYAIVEDGAAHEEILPRHYPGGHGIRLKGELPGNGVVRPVKKIVRVNAQLRDGHTKSPPCRSDRFARGNGLDRDAVDVFGKQGHAHDRSDDSDKGAIVGAGVHAHDAGVAVRGKAEASTSPVGVGRIDVIQNDIVRRSCDHLTACNLGFCQQENGLIPHEVFDVIETELTLLVDDSTGSQVLVHVQNIHERHNVGSSTVHGLELVQDAAFCHCHCFLKGLGSALQCAGIEVLVETSGHIGGQVVQHLLIGHLNSVLVTILKDGFCGRTLGPLFEGDFLIVLGLDGILAVGDLLALANFSVLQGTLCILALQHRVGKHLNLAGYAHNVAQMFPVAAEAGHEVDLACSGLNVSGHHSISFCRHKLVLSIACPIEQVDICCNRGLPFGRILDCKNLVFGHFGAGVGGRVVHLCAGGRGRSHKVAPYVFLAVHELLCVLDLAVLVQLQSINVRAGHFYNAVKVLFQHAIVLQQLLVGRCFRGPGILLGLLGLVLGQRLFCGLLAAVGCITVFLGLCAGCFFCIQLVLEFVRLLVQGVQNGLGLVIVGGFGVLQNRADVSSFECHVLVLSAHARAAMLGNKV